MNARATIRHIVEGSAHVHGHDVTPLEVRMTLDPWFTARAASVVRLTRALAMASVCSFAFGAALHGAVGCAPANGDDGPQVPDAYDLVKRAGFPDLVDPEENPTTVQGVALGRQLYYDNRLSPDGSRACADCHLQQHAFSNPEVVGVLPHINLAWASHFLWDGGFDGTLEHAMQQEVEVFFGTDVERLREPDLEAMFEAAYGSAEITTQKAAFALAQFQRTMVSTDSRFDRFLDGDASQLTAEEQRGMELFYSEGAECFHCHATRLLTDNLFHNIGLEPDSAIAGTGRMHVTGRAADAGAFKTPTLRNIAETAPYMHDDRFATLEDVVDFYSDGVVYSETLDTLMPIVSGGGGFGFSASEKQDLVAFLRALSDEEFLSNPELAPPN
jgi:cytochrome c peroxidase